MPLYLNTQKQVRNRFSLIFQSPVERWKDRPKERDRQEMRECGKTVKGAFVFTAQAGMSVCARFVYLNLSLSVEMVNTDASECLHKQTQSTV